MSTLRTGLLSVVAVLGLACHHDDDDNPPPFTSGVNNSTASVNTLNTSDQTRLCQSYGAHLNATVGFDLIAEALCLPQAILLGGSPEGCQRRLAECTADIPAPLQINAQVSDTHTCTADLAQCNLTVAQLEGCINLRLDWVYAVLNTLSCRGAADSNTQAQANAMRGAAVCAGGAAGCEGFINVQSQPVLF